MIEFGLLAAVALAFLWYRAVEKRTALGEIDRAGTMINAVRDDLAAMDEDEQSAAYDHFAATMSALLSQFPGDASIHAILHRYAFNSSDEKLAETVALGNRAHAVALQRTPSLLVMTAMGAVALAELNRRKYKPGTRFHQAAADISATVRDHFVIASSRTVGDVIKELGLKRFIKYQEGTD